MRLRVRVKVRVRAHLEDGGELVEGGGVLALLDRVKGVQAPRLVRLRVRLRLRLRVRVRVRARARARVRVQVPGLRHASRRGLRGLVTRAVELDGVALEQLLPG